MTDRTDPEPCWSELAILSIRGDNVVIEDAPSSVREECDGDALVEQILTGSARMGSRLRPVSGGLGSVASDWIAKGWSRSLEYFYWSEGGESTRWRGAGTDHGMLSGPPAGRLRRRFWSWTAELATGADGLTSPRTAGDLLMGRRSHRVFDDKAISTASLASILTMLAGHLHMDQPERHLTGMGLSVVVYAVEGLDVGTWDLDPLARELVQVRSGLFRSAMSELMCGMAAPLTASFTVVITCDIHARQQAFPYERALRELYVQTGQVGQWIVIAAETAGLGCLTTPATNDVLLSELLDLPPDRIPLYTVTAGRKIGRNPGPGAVTL